MPARVRAENPDTYRSIPRQTKANGVADEQLNRADILALNMLLPAVLSRVARRTETRDRYTSALASIRSIRTVVLRN